MFRNLPRTYESISDSIKVVSEIGGVGAAELSELLEATNSFLVRTAPEKQSDRDKNISDERMAYIIESAGNALDKFTKLNRTDERSMDLLKLAKNTIAERLQALQKNNDKIYAYYESHDNPLKKYFSKSNELKL